MPNTITSQRSSTEIAIRAAHPRHTRLSLNSRRIHRRRSTVEWVLHRITLIATSNSRGPGRPPIRPAPPRREGR